LARSGVVRVFILMKMALIGQKKAQEPLTKGKSIYEHHIRPTTESEIAKTESGGKWESVTRADRGSLGQLNRWSLVQLA
jgi:hypothetical protein